MELSTIMITAHSVPLQRIILVGIILLLHALPVCGEALLAGELCRHQEPDRNELPKEDSVLLKEKEKKVDRVRKGVYMKGRVWLLLADGIAAYDIATETLNTDILQDTVVDMAVSGGNSFYILTLANTPRAFHILRFKEVGIWDTVAAHPIAENEIPLWLSLHDSSLAGVATTQAIYVGPLDNLQHHEVEMGELGYTLQPSFTLLGETNMFWGRNIGEWGGGLVRWRGALPYVVERRDSDGLCDGPLNSDCDPVTALLPDPLHSDCLFVAVGLRHMMSSGRILRVCGDEVELVYQENCSDSTNWSCPHPIFSLAPAPDGFWAATGDGVLKFDWEGNLQKTVPQPKFKNHDGLWLTTEVPGLLILSTSVNRAASVSGYTPLLISTK